MAVPKFSSPPGYNGSNAMLPIPPQITFRWEFITPEIAERYLQKNYHRNRRARQGWTDQLAHFIASGAFRPTHHAIAFDEEKNLIDGQHRLMAIIEAGEGVWLAIAEGMRLEDVVAVDFGVKRTAVDQAKIGLGRDDISKSTVAIARAMYTGFSTAFARAQTLQLDDLFKFIDYHQESIEFVNQWNGKKAIIAPVLAVCGRAYYYCDRDQLARFLDILGSGLAENQVDRGVVRLRDFLLGWKGMGGASVRAAVQRKTSWVLKAFLEGRTIAKVCETNEDPFPLPSSPNF